MFSFMNTDKEKHAFIIGLFETFPFPLPARYRAMEHTEYDPRHELHYYLMGRSLGFLLDAPLLYGLYRLFI